MISLVCSIMPHMLTSISYTIPPSMLIASHIELKPTIPFNMDDFARYFEYTWIGTTGQWALFPPSAWNHHDASLALLPRSSNMAEGWHNGFRSLVRCSNPTIWSFLDALKLEQGLTDQKIVERLLLHPAPPNRRSGLTLTISYRSLLTPMIMNSTVATSTSSQQFHQFCFKTLFMPLFILCTIFIYYYNIYQALFIFL